MKRFLLIFFALSLRAFATNYNAATLSSADVQAAINLATVPGDTVTLPAGSATWTTTINISGKNITFQGAGIGVTNITDNTSSGNGALKLTVTASNFVRVTGITFISQNTASASNGMLAIWNAVAASNDDVGFRIDHCAFNFPVAVRGITATGVYGLIDHCTFTPSVAGSIHSIDITGSATNSDGGITPWKRPLAYGTNKFVFIEDCTFDYTGNNAGDDCIDCYAGARWVIRHNNFIAISHGSHGLDSGTTQSPHSFEIYNNTYTNSQGSSLRQTTVRGGTGLIHDNTYGGTKSWNPITLQYYRLNNSAPSWAVCDGTNYRVNAVDPTQSGYWVLSTSGSYAFDNATNTSLGAYGGSYTTYFDGAGTNGYPGRQMPGYTTGQVSEPLYAWNNSGGGGSPNVFGTWAGGVPADETRLSSFIVSGRDYNNNTAKPGYTPYTYPHPLISGGGDTTAPTVTIVTPTPPTYNTSSSPLTSLAGTASDNVALSSVTWSCNTGGSGTATGTTSWSVPSITLTSGANIITVTATDTSANISTATLTVNYTPPVIANPIRKRRGATAKAL